VAGQQAAAGDRLQMPNEGILAARAAENPKIMAVPLDKARELRQAWTIPPVMTKSYRSRSHPSAK
jgi:hypothetical protein